MEYGSNKINFQAQNINFRLKLLFVFQWKKSNWTFNSMLNCNDLFFVAKIFQEFKFVEVKTRCEFHQHFMSSFFIRKLYAQLFCTWSLDLYFFVNENWRKSWTWNVGEIFHLSTCCRNFDPNNGRSFTTTTTKNNNNNSFLHHLNCSTWSDGISSKTCINNVSYQHSSPWLLNLRTKKLKENTVSFTDLDRC